MLSGANVLSCLVGWLQAFKSVLSDFSGTHRSPWAVRCSSGTLCNLRGRTVLDLRRLAAVRRSQIPLLMSILGFLDFRMSCHRPAQGERRKKAGDTGDRFSVGAEKVGSGQNVDAARLAYFQAQETALAARRRQQSGINFGG
eukprot:1182119-Prorocentrum_minimum.AAC.5